MFNIVCVGHATTDFFLELDPESSPVVWSQEQEDTFICLDYDDKTPVKNVQWAVGGNAVNSSIGLSRLGIKVGLVSEIGKDKWGGIVKETLEEENVNTSQLRVHPDQKTDLSAILTLNGERTILSYHHPREYLLPTNFPDSDWIYLTSLGEKFEAFHQEFLTQLPEEGVNLAYNPGTYELRAGLEKNRATIERSNLIILNREEAGELVGQRPKEVNRQLADAVQSLGAEAVVITDASKGAFAYDGKNFYQQAAAPVKKVVEKTGAGDAFSAGFLAGIVENQKLKEALKWGVVNGASVIQHVGSNEGLLTRKEMNQKLSGF